MAGYMKGYSEFKDAVSNYLTDIQIADFSETMNLYFINKKIDKTNPDINAYFERLTTSCNAATSDIAKIFQTVLEQTDDSTISIFVTDGIFSPEKGKNASDYLRQQQKDIKEAVANHLLQFPNTAVTVYQLSSKFDGIYYNLKDEKSKINEPRPYYIFVIGNVAHIALLKASVTDDKFKGGGITNSYTLLPSMNISVDYQILNAPKFGSFERDKKSPKTSIFNIEKANKGKGKGQFMFTVGMNLGKFQILLGDDYLMDTDSYARLINKQPSNDYFIEMEHNSVADTQHTHNIKLTTEKIVTGELEVTLRNHFPQWIADVNDEDGSSAVADKTFGIKYLVEGIYEAYIYKGNTIYTTMKFNLKK